MRTSFGARAPSRSALALALAVVLAAGAGLGARTRPTPARPHLLAMSARAAVEVALPPSTPAPRPAARLAWRGPTPASNDCPEMTNPGGHINWNYPVPPGPSPTDGTVSIPVLGVEAPIVRVGFDGGGNMVLPTNARDVAWLDRGPIPGFTNNVVLAGHISWSGVSGSFGRIDELRPGDLVVLRMGGRRWTFAVRFSCLFPYVTDRVGQVYGYTTVPSLTMISCAGSWDPVAHTHRLRIVVRAEQVDPPPPSPAPPPGSGASTPAPTPTSAPPSGGAGGGSGGAGPIPHLVP